VLMLDSIRDFVRYGWYILSQMSTVELLILFWPCFFLDLPRYTLTKIPVLANELLKRFFPRLQRADPTFLARLEAQAVPVTLVVGGYNEEDCMGMTIRSLLDGTYKNIEIIAVDDGSSDHTYVACRAEEKRDPRVRAFRCMRRSGKSSAVNLARSITHGEFIIVVDADTTFEPHAIENVLQPFADPRVGAVSGNLRVRNRFASLCAKFQAAEYLKCISTGRRWMSWAGYLSIASGAFGAFRRTAIESVGGWDVGPGEDADTTLKIRKKGHLIRFAPKAISYTNVPVTFRKLAKQRTRWNRNYVRRLRKHRDVFAIGKYDLGTHLNYFQGFLFRVVITFSILVYLFYLVFHFGSALPHVVVFVLFFYAMTNAFTLSVAVLLSPDIKEDLELLPLAPLLPFFRAFLKFVRARAYFMEFLRVAGFDPYVPARVQREVPRW
jgi:poly-beta-1,6-N-acetyl-D-glucosamine synthase